TAPAVAAPDPAAGVAALASSSSSSTDAQGGDAASSGDALAAASTDFETFLTLLTAQMRNQDPLQPVESTEFVAQLASFSAVEQQIGTNERLDSLLDAMNGGSGAGLAEWIGREVRAAAPTRFDGDPVEVLVRPQPDAVAASLVVRDSTGAVVQTQTVDPASETVSWSGQTGIGIAPEGTYSFDVEYTTADGEISVVAAEVYAEVVEVRLSGDGAASLILDGGGEVASDDVTALRNAPAVGEEA
ncbi:MAG: flagellar hook capping FlgD N-terminal domain-containing protein, partial [Pseudomonadota bacterium]